MAATATVLSPQAEVETKTELKPTLTPPASEEADKQDDSGSELSDLDLDPEDVGDIEPDHYYEGGKIPVFKPVRQGWGAAGADTCLYQRPDFTLYPVKAEDGLEIS